MSSSATVSCMAAACSPGRADRRQCVTAAIGELTDLAPLHQPRALAGDRRDPPGLLPGVPGVACFDTAFHAGLPRPPPRRTRCRRLEQQVRAAAVRLSWPVARLRRSPGRCCSAGSSAGLRIVSCHLGGGASLAAIQGGRSVDTTMGFTPLEGLVMATRSGSVDPGLLMWLLQHGRLPSRRCRPAWSRHPAWPGCPACRQVTCATSRAAADAASAAARLAIEVYLHRLRREIAAMAAAMNGLDVLVFTGGIGEHTRRSGRTQRMAWASSASARPRDATGRQRTRRSATRPAAVRALVVTAREDIEIARQTRRVLQRRSPPRRDRSHPQSLPLAPTQPGRLPGPEWREGRGIGAGR